MKAAVSWMGEGRSSLVVALGVALVVPSVNTTVFDGIPLAGAWEIFATVTLLPFVLSGELRGRLQSILTRRGTRGTSIALGATFLVIVLKLLLLAFATDQGFTACYVSTWRPPASACESAYSNVFQRHGGATRVDQQLDFGPTDSQGSKLVTSPAIPAEREGVATTNWNLSFANDLRFDQPVTPGGGNLHALMPFKVTWTGTASIPSDGHIEVVYAGSGHLEVGGRWSIYLPASPSPRTLAVTVPPGDQPLSAEYAYAAAYNAPFAEFRLLDHSGDPVGAAPPSLVEWLAASLVWLVLAVLFAGLAVVMLSALDWQHLGLLAGVAICAGIFALLSDGFVAFQYLAAIVAPVLVWRRGRHTVLWAYLALVLILMIGLLNVAGSMHDVIYNSIGSDFLAYQSFAREIILGGSLRGGEDVFYLQPGSRYLLALMHLAFGDGDVLVTFWSMLLVTMPVAALLVWHRRRVESPLLILGIGAAGFLLLATLASPTILSLFAVSASEVPTWSLLALAVAAPQLRPSRSSAWVGSMAAAALIWVTRNNQAVAAVAILVAIGVALRQRRRLLALGAVVVVVIVALPLIHNLIYGGAAQLSTTGISSGKDQEIGISDLPQVFNDNAIGSQIRGHIGSLFYDPPIPGITENGFRWLLYALLGLWIGAVIVALVNRRRGLLTPTDWILLPLPVAYLAPHVIYPLVCVACQNEVYYPRHIVAGYLAMGVCAIGVFSAIDARRRLPAERPSNPAGSR